MKRIILISLLLTFCLFNTVDASNIDGKWKGKMKSPDGDMELTFNFKVVKTDSLTGTVQGPMGEMNISNGKVNDNTFTFDVDANGMSIHHQCKLLNDSISMKVSGFQGGDMEIILKK